MKRGRFSRLRQKRIHLGERLLQANGLAYVNAAASRQRDARVGAIARCHERRDGPRPSTAEARIGNRSRGGREAHSRHRPSTDPVGNQGCASATIPQRSKSLVAVAGPTSSPAVDRSAAFMISLRGITRLITSPPSFIAVKHLACHVWRGSGFGLACALHQRSRTRHARPLQHYGPSGEE